MRYMDYYPNDAINGEGIRCTLFVAGCSHACEGCYNESSWNPQHGQEFDSSMVERIIDDLNDTRIIRDGLSLSGGDPLHKRNTASVFELVKRVKHECPTKNIWMWSGYYLRDIRDNKTYMDILEYVDVFVDGPFELEMKDPALAFRGSSNQTVWRRQSNGDWTSDNGKLRPYHLADRI